jgi:soluble P-type ATPase
MSVTVSIPGWDTLSLTNALFDLNGTLALDGIMAESTRERLTVLGDVLTLYVMSADTHGTLEQVCGDLPLTIQRVQTPLGAPAKRQLLESLGSQQTVAVGNGRNDVLMLKAAALGIAIIGPEGAAKEALLAADLVFSSIDEALDSLLNPARLLATLRG